MDSSLFYQEFSLLIRKYHADLKIEKGRRGKRVGDEENLLQYHPEFRYMPRHRIGKVFKACLPSDSLHWNGSSYE
jgi:hypothetical protein